MAVTSTNSTQNTQKVQEEIQAWMDMRDWIGFETFDYVEGKDKVVRIIPLPTAGELEGVGKWLADVFTVD